MHSDRREPERRRNERNRYGCLSSLLESVWLGVKCTTYPANIAVDVADGCTKTYAPSSTLYMTSVALETSYISASAPVPRVNDGRMNETGSTALKKYDVDKQGNTEKQSMGLTLLRRSPWSRCSMKKR